MAREDQLTRHSLLSNQITYPTTTINQSLSSSMVSANSSTVQRKSCEEFQRKYGDRTLKR